MRRTIIGLCALLIASCGDDDKTATDATSGVTDVATQPGDADAPKGPDAEPTDASATDADATHDVEPAPTDTATDEGDAALEGDARDTGAPEDAVSEPADADALDETADAEPSCLQQGHAAGARYSVGDHCNFCDCLPDGSSVCTKRACGNDPPSCTYDGVEHAFGQRFDATDGCNECVCAASGLACTRRCPELPEEGAILLESLDTPCGDDPSFTGAAVMTGLPADELSVPFSYRREGGPYPETLTDTTLTLRVVHERGFVVCRLPSPSQPAIDMEVAVEWITADGAFDEGLHTYLRRNNFGFVDAWTTVASVPAGGLDGSFDPNCRDAAGFGFSATFDADGRVSGRISKTCEIDISLDVGTFDYTP